MKHNTSMQIYHSLHCQLRQIIIQLSIHTITQLTIIAEYHIIQTSSGVKVYTAKTNCLDHRVKQFFAVYLHPKMMMQYDDCIIIFMLLITNMMYLDCGIPSLMCCASFTNDLYLYPTQFYMTINILHYCCLCNVQELAVEVDSKMYRYQSQHLQMHQYRPQLLVFQLHSWDTAFPQQCYSQIQR